MSKLYATRVEADQLEGRTGDRRIRPGAPSHAADECRLAGAKLARQEDHVARLESLAEALSGVLGLGR